MKFRANFPWSHIIDAPTLDKAREAALSIFAEEILRLGKPVTKERFNLERAN
jgi:hypothetical protein